MPELTGRLLTVPLCAHIAAMILAGQARAIHPVELEVMSKEQTFRSEDNAFCL